MVGARSETSGAEGEITYVGLLKPMNVKSAILILNRGFGVRGLVMGLAVSLVVWRALDWAVEFEAATMLRPMGLLVLVFWGSLVSVTGRGDR